MNKAITQAEREGADAFHAPVEVQSDSSSLMAVIARAAADPAVNIDKMERLLAMQERLATKESEREFNSAMTAAQAALGRVAPDANNPQTKSKYASYAALDRVLRPVYTEHGFALSFDTGTDAPENYVRVRCIVSHSSGHSRAYSVDMPADGKGAKGGDVMTKTHAVGSALSYGARYLLKLIFNIAVGETDDDGNGAGDPGASVTTEQLAWLRDSLEKTNSNIEVFCQYFKIQALPEMKQRDYPRAVEMLNHKARPKSAKAASAQ